MLFNSIIFLIFLTLVFTGYWLIPRRFRNYFLLLASYYFYYSYSPWFLLLLIATSTFDFWCARQIQSAPQQKKLFLYLSVISNIGVLVAFKYSAFLFNTGVQISNGLAGTHYSFINSFVIPAGLSFYTFQSLSYTIDVYRGKYKANDTIYEFLLYVSFFPHMVAGPVVRYNDLMPQLKMATYFKSINWQSFATLTTWGFFKKMVIADNLDDIVSYVFNNVTAFSGIELLAAGILFVIQVYCDFSGYSDIATGVAKLFNINLSLNWRRPLLSCSLHEFWTRNHISITTWFRDYLYIALGGNRVSYKRWLLNIFLVFVISALWHGANFTFLVWGSIHGVFFILEILAKQSFPNLKVPSFIGWLYLICIHTISLIAFRANNITDLIYIYHQLFSFSVPHSASILLSIKDHLFMIVIAFMILVLVLKEINEEYALINKFPKLYNNLKPVVYILLLAFIFIFGDFSANTFIYFQF